MKTTGFLDLSEAGKSRQELRLMEKRIKSNRYYLGKRDKVYFFRFLNEAQLLQFFHVLLTDIRQYGHGAYYTNEIHSLQNLKK